MQAVPNQGDQVFPVAVIEGEVHPRRQEAVFGAAGKNKANVLRQVLLVVLEDAAGISLVVAPGSEKLGRNLIVRVAYDFTNEGADARSNCTSLGYRRTVRGLRYL